MKTIDVPMAKKPIKVAIIVLVVILALVFASVDRLGFALKLIDVARQCKLTA